MPQFFKKVLAFFKRQRYNVRALVKHKQGTNTMQSKTFNHRTGAPKKPWYRNSNVSAIIGVGLVFTVVSIAYSSYIVWFGTTGAVPKVMLAPQMVLAAGFVIYKFTK